MPKFTYPVVFIFNEATQQHNGYLPDLNIRGVGDSPEDVYAGLEDTLKNYMKISGKYNLEIPEPSKFDDIVNKWPGYKVSLISADVK